MLKQAKIPTTPAVKELARIPGAEPSARMDAWWWLFVLAVVTIAFLAIAWPDPYRRIIFFVSDGIWVTVYITLISFVCILVTGLVGGLGRLSTNRIIYGLASLYVELIRGIPLLVQLIWWYYAFPVVLQNIGRGLNLGFLANFQANADAMAVLGLTICYGAYMSEIYRAGIQSIPRGQMEAARSLGMTYFQSMRLIVLPQAIRVIMPPVGNEFITLLKDSSLVSAVAVADMTRRGREFMSTNFNPIQTWMMVALLYLVLTVFAARIVSFIEKRTKVER
jgi:polar amino acid transport system permease protein